MKNMQVSGAGTRRWAFRVETLGTAGLSARLANLESSDSPMGDPEVIPWKRRQEEITPWIKCIFSGKRAVFVGTLNGTL